MRGLPTFSSQASATAPGSSSSGSGAPEADIGLLPTIGRSALGVILDASVGEEVERRGNGEEGEGERGGHEGRRQCG